MSKQPLLLIHGALYESRTFEPITEALSERFNPFTLDLPGHGTAPFPTEEFSIELFGRAVLQLLDERGIETIDIFGYSMGGYIGLWLAGHHPERIGRVMTLGTKMEWSPEGARREVAMLDPDVIEEKVPAFGATLRERHGDDRYREVLRRTATMMTNLGAAPELTPEALGSINTPVRMMVGDRDRMVSIDETVTAYRQIPGAELAVLPGTGHPLERVNLPLLLSNISAFFFVIEDHA